jgi:hypothetical protein
MAYIAHLIMMHEVTVTPSKGTKPSISPFVAYLRAGKPLNEDVRRWLLALLSDKGHHGIKLTLKSTRGRRRSKAEFERDIEAYDYYQDMRGQPITRRLCEQYARALKAKPIKFFTTEKQIADGFHRADRTTYYVQRKKEPNINLVKGKPLPNFVALCLAAAKYNRAPDTLRKTIAQIDRAKQTTI